MSFHSWLLFLEVAYIKTTGWRRGGRRTLQPGPTSLKEAERLKMAGRLSLLEAGCPSSSWGAPGLSRPLRQGAQTGPCALQAVSFTGLPPASVF